MTIDNVTTREKIQADWGNSVADAINDLEETVDLIMEQDTFTPLLSTSVTGPTFSGTPTATGRYRRIGNHVHVSFYIAGVVNNSPSGTFLLGQLPFTAINNPSLAQVGASTGGSGTTLGTYGFRNVTDGVAQTGILGLRNTLTIWLLQPADGTGLTTTEMSVANGKEIVATGSFSYYVDLS